MSTAQMNRPAQTLYVTIRRDELRQLKDERDQLLMQVAQLQMQLQGPSAVALAAPAHG
ncbi:MULTISPECIES: DUF6026 family protein [Pseudomonas]|jgi:hypothetical protein|uniref:Uncharacterized protein n=3 Tax=Pseudomonas TaxID=286 RepID=A0A5M9J606_9PSED|nr:MULTISPECIES: DUF6026 family protein [Pseudomonas]AHC36186.1 hypothetical protein U771_18345 [Pseudomonas sp. TKP]KAA8563379.1 hypothetical protein FX985_03448 [Pseudomonas extremaustralis]MBL1309393.1 hypothetical protein [Pseudomonas sp.]MDR6577445.1 hypothetical protein [Pseudomonas extremaustralis]QOU02685.1 hypothetical protein IM720_18360 [Pseudomonas fluorescens]